MLQYILITKLKASTTNVWYSVLKRKKLCHRPNFIFSNALGRAYVHFQIHKHQNYMRVQTYTIIRKTHQSKYKALRQHTHTHTQTRCSTVISDRINAIQWIPKTYVPGYK